MRTLLVAVMALVVGITLPATSVHADYNSGLAAYKRGDYETAKRELLPLAQRGNANAQNYMGLMYEHGRGVAKNLRTARGWYQRAAAEQNNAWAQNQLGLIYSRGIGVTQDYFEAVKWTRKSAEQGFSWGQNNLGIFYKDGKGLAQNDNEAVKWFRKAADQGNASAQNWLGVMYSQGRGVTKDKVEALSWYRKAAANGNSWAEHNLGLMYQHGDGVVQDDVEAVRWFRKSVSQGNRAGQNGLGVMYKTGRGVSKDDKEAAKWYKKAADQGDKIAQSNLGSLYESGEGVPKNTSQAISWYRKSANQGHPRAIYRLGLFYERGSGVRKDLTKAQEYFRKASNSGEPGAKAALDRVSALIRKQASAEARETQEAKEQQISLNKRAQAALRSLGHYDGAIDGALGPKSRTAIRDWQRSRGLATSGTLSNKQIDMLAADARAEDERLAELAKQREAEADRLAVLKRKADEEARRLAEMEAKRTAIEEARRAEEERKRQEMKAAAAQALEKKRRKLRHAVAVIVGNHDYQDMVPDVQFAGNDADRMFSYVTETLGYDPANVIDLRNTTLGQLNAVFGSERDHEGRLFDYVRPGKSDVIVFYSGHGVPGLDDKRGYLLPVDGDPNQAENTGYSLDLMMTNIAKVPAKSISVYLDACFSGETPNGMLINSFSGITIEARSVDPTAESVAPMVVVAAARGDQVASWDLDAKHGLFTKHLLDGLNGAADGEDYGDGDGRITLGELEAYLGDEMTYQARRRFSRKQEPDVKGDRTRILAGG